MNVFGTALLLVDGRDAIVIEHVTGLAHDIPPVWPTGIGDLSYRVTTTGDPEIDCRVAATLSDPKWAGIAAVMSEASAMRVL